MPALLQDLDRPALRSERRLLAPRRGGHHPPRRERSLLVPGPAVLAYRGDRRLTEGVRLLADFDARADGSYGRVTAAGIEYEILRRHRRGWDFFLEESPSGACVCTYAPFRIGRGGSLACEHAESVLRGVPLRPHRWSYVDEDDWEAAIRVARRYPEPELSLEAAKPLPAGTRSAAVLAFCCWLIVEWESLQLPGGGG
jgi:hypothetical protein